MRRLSLLLAVALAACTALAMTYLDKFTRLEVVPIGGFGLTPFDLVLYLTLIVVGVNLWSNGRLPEGGAMRFATFVIIAYVAYQVLVVVPITMTIKGYSVLGALYAIGPRLSIVLVLFFAILVARHRSHRLVWLILDCAAVALLLVAFWRYFTGSEVFVEQGTGRVRVLWGGVSLLFGWLAVSRLLADRIRLRDLALGAGGLVGIALINHRSAFMALAAAFAAFMLTSWRRVPRTIGVVFTLIVLVVVLVYAFLPALGTGLQYSITTMFDAGADFNTVDRVYRYRLGLEQFAADPFGDVTWRGSYYLFDLGEDANYPPHNFVVQLLAGEGLIGFLLWSALLTTGLVVAFRNSRRDHASAILGAYLVFYLTFCLFNANFSMIHNVLLLVAPLGMILWRDRALTEPVSPQTGPETVP